MNSTTQCALCGSAVDFDADAGGEGLAFPLPTGYVHALEDQDAGAVPFCSDGCAEALGFAPEALGSPEAFPAWSLALDRTEPEWWRLPAALAAELLEALNAFATPPLTAEDLRRGWSLLCLDFATADRDGEPSDPVPYVVVSFWYRGAGGRGGWLNSSEWEGFDLARLYKFAANLETPNPHPDASPA